MSERVSRRDALKKVSLTVLAGGLGGFGALGCGKKDLTCTDVAGLSADEASARTTLGYAQSRRTPQRTAPTACSTRRASRTRVAPARS